MMILSFQSTPSAWRETHTPPKLHQLPHISIHSLRMEGDPVSSGKTIRQSISIHSLRMEGDEMSTVSEYVGEVFQSTPSAWRETIMYFVSKMEKLISIHSLRMEGDCNVPVSDLGGIISIHSLRMEGDKGLYKLVLIYRRISIHSLRMEGDKSHAGRICRSSISIHSLRMEGDSKTAQESVFHFAYPCTILQKRMQKTTFCTRKNGFFRKKGEKFGAKPSASFCAPMIRTDTFPLNFSHRISGSSMSMVSFAPICSTFD